MPKKKSTQQTNQTLKNEELQPASTGKMSLHHRLTKTVQQFLDDHDSGFAPLSFEQLLRLKAALDADRPSAFIVMTVLANELDFLNHRYTGEPTTLPIISDFLAQFQQAAAHDLLAKEHSIREGLTLIEQS